MYNNVEIIEDNICKVKGGRVVIEGGIYTSL
jgi:hypothetical protein